MGMDLCKRERWYHSQYSLQEYLLKIQSHGKFRDPVKSLFPYLIFFSRGNTHFHPLQISRASQCTVIFQATLERQGRLIHHLFSPPGTCGRALGLSQHFPFIGAHEGLAKQSQTHQGGFLVGRRDAFRVVNSEEAVNAVFCRP